MINKKVILLILIMIITAASTACSSNSAVNSDVNSGVNFGESYDTPTYLFETESSVIEEALTTNTLNSGVYSFYNVSENCYLSYNDRALILSTEPASWEVKVSGFGGSYVYSSKNNLLLDIDNAYVNEGTTIKLWKNTGYNTQTWNITDNGNSTYSICSTVESNYCLGFENGAAVLQTKDKNNTAQQWTVIEMPKNYISFTSTNSVIELNMPLDIMTVITETRLQQWANDLETAYYSFYELTGFIPYDTIIVEAYKPCEYIAYVIDNSNIIHIDKEFIYGDLKKMEARNCDWNFCALHEMGHMFDMGRPWNFEAEVMTDLKVAYVLEKNGAAATPSEFDASYSYYGANIVSAYEYLGCNAFPQSYNIFGCAVKLLRIKDAIGWEAFTKTFHYLEENYDTYSTLSGQEKFKNFITLLSHHSGTDVTKYFSHDEWNCILSACNQ